MVTGLGASVALIERLTGVLIDSDVPLDREHLRAAVKRLAAAEAPLAGQALFDQVIDGLVGLGPLEILLRDPAVSDVLVNAHDDVYVERAGKLFRTDVRFADDSAIVAAVERVIAPLGLRLDRASPTIDARLPDGSRLHAVIPPAAVDHPVVAVRRFVRSISSLDDLVDRGSITKAQSGLLSEAVLERRNILVSGGTGTGRQPFSTSWPRSCRPGNERSPSRMQRNLLSAVTSFVWRAGPPMRRERGQSASAHSFVPHCGCARTAS